MKTRVLFAAVLFLIVLFFFGDRSFAQAESLTDQSINALRSDLKADKAEILKEAMQLKPEEAKSFWSVYEQYQGELSRINDDLVQIIKIYSKKYPAINDADARELTLKAFDCESKKISLKKKYFPIFSKATTPFTAAKFFQVEHRLELLFNLQLASELPVLLHPLQADAPAKEGH